MSMIDIETSHYPKPEKEKEEGRKHLLLGVISICFLLAIAGFLIWYFAY